MKNAITVFSIVFLCSMGAAFASSPGEQALNLAKSMEAEGNFKQAINHYRRAASFAEVLEPATIGLAHALIETGNIEEAKATLDEFLTVHNPFHIEAHLLMADIYQRKGDFTNAMKEVDTVEHLRPGLTKTAETRGIVEFKLGHFDHAIELLSGVIKTQGDVWTSRYYRAKAYMGATKWDKAADDLHFLVEEKPSNLEAQNMLAECLINLAKWQDAEKVLLFALKVNATDIPALTKLSEIYKAKDRKDDLIGTYKKLVEIEPNNMENSQKLSETYIRLKLYKNAEDELQRQLKVNPGSDVSAQRLVFVWGEQKRFDLVGSFLKDFIEKWPNHTWAYFDYAALFIKIGKTTQAENYLEKVAHGQVDNLPFQLMLANVKYKNEKLNDAQKILSRAEDSFPKDPRVKFNLGLVLEKLGHDEAALKKYGQVGPKDNLYDKAQINFALLCEKLGRSQLAADALKSIPAESEYYQAAHQKVVEMENVQKRSVSTESKE